MLLFSNTYTNQYQIQPNCDYPCQILFKNTWGGANLSLKRSLHAKKAAEVAAAKKPDNAKKAQLDGIFKHRGMVT